MPSSHSRRGRIRPSQRDTNDAAPIIGEEFDELGTGYAARLHETAKQDKDENTRKDYRRRIIKICKFLEEHCPKYYEHGTRSVVEPELDSTCYTMGVSEIEKLD